MNDCIAFTFQGSACFCLDLLRSNSTICMTPPCLSSTKWASPTWWPGRHQGAKTSQGGQVYWWQNVVLKLDEQTGIIMSDCVTEITVIFEIRMLLYHCIITIACFHLNSKELREGGKILVEKLKKFKPLIAVFNGKCKCFSIVDQRLR